MRNRKAQITAELMLGIGMILFLFLIVSVFVVKQRVELNNKEDYIKMRSECLKIANLINSAYITGPGTEIRTRTNYEITIYNTSQIAVGFGGFNASNTTNNTPRIAFLASEGGPTDEAFYDNITSLMNNSVDWYKICFSDIGGADCSGAGTSWMDTRIQNTFTDLMNNLSSYTTLYLESPAIQDENKINVYEKIMNWTAQGHALIIAGDLMCNAGENSDCPTCYACKDKGDLGINNWNFTDVNLSQRTENSGFENTATVIIVTTTEILNLVAGEQLNFNKFNFVKNLNASNFITIGTYKTINQIPSPSRGKIAIASWNYGSGKIFYFGDPTGKRLKVMSTGRTFAEVLAGLAKIAYYLIPQPGVVNGNAPDILCSFSAFSSYQKITGEILIKNINNYIWLENVNTSI